MWGKFGPYEDRWSYAERYVPEMKADIICLQESGDLECLNRLEKATGIPVILHDCGQTGLAVLSRMRCERHDLVPYETRSRLETYVRKFQWLEFRYEGAPFLVTNTHLAWKKGDDVTRKGQVSELAAFLKSQQKPALLCGDFNCEYHSTPLQDLRASGYKDILEGTVYEKQPTWDNSNPFIQSHAEKFPDRRIDLILAHPDFLELRPSKKASIEFKKPTPAGLFVSDHWGVIADFE